MTLRKLRVYKQFPISDAADIAFDPSITAEEVIPLLRIQEANSKTNKFGLMIQSSDNTYSWIPQKIPFTKLIVMNDDVVFAEPLNKIICVSLPDRTEECISFDMTTPARNAVELICSHFGIWPHQVWSMYTKTETGKTMIIPDKSIAEQFPGIQTVLMRQTLFSPYIDSSIATPLHIYISQYRQMILDHEFLLSEKDLESLKSYQWYNMKERIIPANSSNTEKEEELEHITSLQGFGTMNFRSRIHLCDGEGKITDQLPRVFSISDVSISIYRYGNPKPELVRSFTTIYGFSNKGPYIKIAFDRKGNNSWFVMSSKSAEILSILESSIRLKQIMPKQEDQDSRFVTTTVIPIIEKPLIQDLTFISEEEALGQILTKLYYAAKECINDREQKRCDNSSTKHLLTFNSLVQSMQSLMNNKDSKCEEQRDIADEILQEFNSLMKPCKKKQSILAFKNINSAIEKARSEVPGLNIPKPQRTRNSSKSTDSSRQNKKLDERFNTSLSLITNAIAKSRNKTITKADIQTKEAENKEEEETHEEEIQQSTEETKIVDITLDSVSEVFAETETPKQVEIINVENKEKEEEIIKIENETEQENSDTSYNLSETSEQEETTETTKEENTNNEGNENTQIKEEESESEELFTNIKPAKLINHTPVSNAFEQLEAFKEQENKKINNIQIEESSTQKNNSFSQAFDDESECNTQDSLLLSPIPKKQMPLIEEPDQTRNNTMNNNNNPIENNNSEIPLPLFNNLTPNVNLGPINLTLNQPPTPLNNPNTSFTLNTQLPPQQSSYLSLTPERQQMQTNQQQYSLNDYQYQQYPYSSTQNFPFVPYQQQQPPQTQNQFMNSTMGSPILPYYQQQPQQQMQMSPNASMMSSSFMNSFPVPAQQFSQYPQSPIRNDQNMQSSTPASPVNVKVSIDNSKKKKSQRSSYKKHRKHKHSSSSSDSYESEDESESEYIPRSKSRKMRRSYQPVAKKLFKEEEQQRFIDTKNLKTEDLLSELEETIDRIEMALESNESTRGEQNVLAALLEELEKRKQEFSENEAFEDLIFSAKKISDMRSISIAKVNRIGDDIEQQIKTLRKYWNENKLQINYQQKEKEKSSQNIENSPLFQLSSTLNMLPRQEKKKETIEPINIPFTFVQATQEKAQVEGDKVNTELQKSLDLLKESILNGSQSFSNF